ncbi:MAG: hypothetical protein V1767_08470 [Chloroflexota bacterium]
MSKQQTNPLLLVLNMIGFLGTVIVNGLATNLPLNNKTTAELSDQYPNLFVPAGLTFSIWGIIYVLLTVFVVYHLVTVIRNDAEGLSSFGKIGVLFFISSALNISWIFAWHYEIVPLSVVIMLLLLASLIIIYLRLGIGKSATSLKVQYLVHLPFSVYLGWITIATIANITALLVEINWNRLGVSEQFWTVLVVIVGIAITLGMLIKRGDIYYCLVVDWALLGILLKRMASFPVVQNVIVVTIIGLVLITLGIVVQILRKKVYVSPASG